MAERVVSLTGVIRYVDKPEGLNIDGRLALIDEYCEQRNVILTRRDRLKIKRNYLGHHVIEDTMDLMQTFPQTYPPFGLFRMPNRVTVRPSQDLTVFFRQLESYDALTCVDKAPINLSQTVGRVCEDIKDTTVYAVLMEARNKNPYYLKIPEFFETQTRDHPVDFLRRGLGTASKVMIKFFETGIHHFELAHGRKPTAEELRGIALDSIGYLEHFATYNLQDIERINQGIDQGYDVQQGQYFASLDTQEGSLSFVKPVFKKFRDSFVNPNPKYVTTGCPALVSDTGKPSQIERMTRIALDIIAPAA